MHDQIALAHSWMSVYKNAPSNSYVSIRCSLSARLAPRYHSENMHLFSSLMLLGCISATLAASHPRDFSLPSPSVFATRDECHSQGTKLTLRTAREICTNFVSLPLQAIFAPRPGLETKLTSDSNGVVVYQLKVIKRSRPLRLSTAIATYTSELSIIEDRT
jgi:hypothetical protein